MSLTGGSKFILTGGANYQIARSLRFRASNSAYLSRTPGTPTSSTTFIWSGWIKLSNFGTNRSITGGYDGASYDDLRFQSTDVIRFYVDAAAGGTIDTTAVFRDPSAWYHVILAVDTTQATQANRCFIIVNGVAQTLTGNTLSLSYSFLYFNKSGKVNNIGRFGYNATAYLDGYMGELNFVDGYPTGVTQGTWSASTIVALFGQTDATTGAWVPKAYSGTYGNNGFYLPFSDNSAATSTTIGKDFSGNGNNWTPTNISVTAGVTNDSLVDTPTNYGTEDNLGGTVRANFPTLNPLKVGASIVLSNANLAMATSSLNATRTAFATQGTSTQKFFFEVTPSVNSNGNLVIGVANESMAITTDPNIDANGWGFSPHTSSPQKNNGGTAGYGTATASMGVGSTFICAVDPNNGSSGKIYMGVANAWMASSDPTTGTSPMFSNLSGTLFPILGHDSGTSQSVAADINFGQRAFVNTSLLAGLLAAGYKPLNTQNLPTPAIVKPSLYMDVNTRTGTGAAFSVTGKLFQPDLVWSKGRSGATDHAIYDAVRTATKDLGSNLATDETTQVQGLTAFNSDGFSGGTLAKINTSAATYVDWMWKKGVTPGIDVVSYTGNGANRTIAHTLGVVPSMMIVKSRTTAGADTGWAVYHSALANTEYLKLETTAAKATGATYWNSTTPTSSVFSLGTSADTNTNLDTYINYLFAEVAGFSKFGSYTGNGSTDGPFVWCGFRPRFLLIKSSTAVDAWLIYDSARDTYNVMPDTLVPNTTAAEAAISGIDFLSNGFKLRTITTTPNAAQTYIFAAFAEAPFKTARAR